MIVLYFNNEDVERGPGLWILNNELLYDGIYKEKIMRLIQKEKICMLYNTFFIMVDFFKYKIKKCIAVLN